MSLRDDVLIELDQDIDDVLVWIYSSPFPTHDDVEFIEVLVSIAVDPLISLIRRYNACSAIQCFDLRIFELALLQRLNNQLEKAYVTLARDSGLCSSLRLVLIRFGTECGRSSQNYFQK